MIASQSIQPSANIQSALRRASQVTGTDFDYLLRTARRESAFKTDVKSKTSSATGLFQFVEETWLATLKQVGGAFGLGKVANAIERTASGRHKVPDPKLRREILALRKDPQTSALMAAALTRQSAGILAGKLGRAPVAGELYMAHFLGPAGASKLITAATNRPAVPAARLFPAAAAANRSIFYDHSGTPRTARAVYNNLLSQHGARQLAFSKPAAATAAGDAQAAERARFAAVGSRRPLLHRLFVSGYRGDAAATPDTAPARPGLSTMQLKVLADARPASPSALARSSAPARGAVGGPSATGLLSRPRLRGLNGTLTYELFRTIG